MEHCKYCDKKLGVDNGEKAHGCLDCVHNPLVSKIDDLEKQIDEIITIIYKVHQSVLLDPDDLSLVMAMGMAFTKLDIPQEHKDIAKSQVLDR